jgi:hypothetical protein
MVMEQPQEPFAITPAYDILLRGSEQMPIGLYHLHLATAEQLCRLHYSMGSIKWVKAKLRMLCDHGYVQYDAMPTKFTRSPYYYTMGKLGMQYLHKAGFDINKAFRAGKEVDKQALFVRHTLELNDIIIAAALLKRYSNYWLGDFIHERELKRHPYKVPWQGRPLTLIPDTYLSFRVRLPDGKQLYRAVLVEHDRGTEEQQHFRRHIRSYIAMLKSKAYVELFRVKNITIAFSTLAGAERLKQMHDWALKELDATREPNEIRGAFRFTNLTRLLEPQQVWLEPSWYTLFDWQPIPLLVGV